MSPLVHPEDELKQKIEKMRSNYAASKVDESIIRFRGAITTRWVSLVEGEYLSP